MSAFLLMLLWSSSIQESYGPQETFDIFEADCCTDGFYFDEDEVNLDVHFTLEPIPPIKNITTTNTRWM